MSPKVIMNMAMSVDGKVSSVRKEPTLFTSREDKKMLQVIRGKCDAIITAARTVRIDRVTQRITDPKLQKQRAAAGRAVQPVRVVVSGSLSLSPDLPIFKKNESPLVIVCCEKVSRAKRVLFSKLGRVFVCGKTEVNVKKLIRFLAREYKTRVILCEGGPTLNSAFFKANAVNELYLTLCPRIVGGKSAPTIVEGEVAKRLKDARRAKLISCKKGSEEYFLRYKFN